MRGQPRGLSLRDCALPFALRNPTLLGRTWKSAPTRFVRYRWIVQDLRNASSVVPYKLSNLHCAMGDSSPMAQNDKFVVTRRGELRSPADARCTPLRSPFVRGNFRGRFVNRPYVLYKTDCGQVKNRAPKPTILSRMVRIKKTGGKSPACRSRGVTLKIISSVVQMYS